MRSIDEIVKGAIARDKSFDYIDIAVSQFFKISEKYIWTPTARILRYEGSPGYSIYYNEATKRTVRVSISDLLGHGQEVPEYLVKEAELNLILKVISASGESHFHLESKPSKRVICPNNKKRFKLHILFRDIGTYHLDQVYELETMMTTHLEDLAKKSETHPVYII